MIISVLICLTLALVPVELKDPPVGCVTIKNLSKGKYLTHSSSSFDNERRHVSLWPTAEVWKLTKSGDHYRLRHKDKDEELYESDKQTGGGNYVFTWIPKTDRNQAAEFDIWQSSPGFFIIQNVWFRHCLSSNMWKGWVNGYKDCEKSDANEWRIEAATC